MKIRNDQKEKARQTDLFEYLINHHYDDIKIEGNSLRLRENKSVVLKKGTNWYKDFSTGEVGNPIDLLIKEFGYSFPDAVLSLCEEDVTVSPTVKRESTGVEKKKIILPPKSNNCKNLYGYLCSRGITADLIRRLIKEGLLYQETEHNNIIFVNNERDYCELHGSLSYGEAFHGCLKSKSDNFWWFTSENKKPEIIYICEAAIDAMSLYILHQKQGMETPCAYISIGGVANQQTIDRIKNNLPVPVVIAVDNDEAGDQCRKNNPELQFIIPTKKDWNEDLMELKNTLQKVGDSIDQRMDQ